MNAIFYPNSLSNSKEKDIISDRNANNNEIFCDLRDNTKVIYAKSSSIRFVFFKYTLHTKQNFIVLGNLHLFSTLKEQSSLVRKFLISILTTSS